MKFEEKAYDYNLIQGHDKDGSGENEKNIQKTNCQIRDICIHVNEWMNIKKVGSPDFLQQFK